jgi:plasmid stabilization system protein ParE
MVWKLAYYDEVKQDVKDAKDWYFKRQPGLEKRFALDVKEALDRLKKNPLQYEVKYRNVRTALCRVFPYAIHFYLDEPAGRLVVIAIVHQHRDPEFSRNR